MALRAKGLVEDSPNQFSWEKVLINEYYDPEKEFIGVSEKTGKRVRFKRIDLCFEIEDPRIFAKRVKNAHDQRKLTDARVRYNFYIDNMPTQDLNEIDYEQKTRLVTYAQNSKALQESKALNAEELTNEANQEYSRTMNKIIFNEYFDDANKDLVPFELNIGEDHIEEVSYYGMINIPKANVTTESKEVGYIYPNTRDFTEIFKEFCFSSLFIKEEVIKALQEIKVACNEVVENEIFTLQFENIVRIEEFKTIQESSISQLMSH